MLNTALCHHHNHVGDGNRLDLGVGDVHEGDTELLLHAPQLPSHLQAQELIEGRQATSSDCGRVARRLTKMSGVTFCMSILQPRSFEGCRAKV
jgi:hypothetical protein